MTLHPKTCGAAALLALLAAPAVAQITADNVWSNANAVVTAFGGTLSGEVTRTGETLTIADPTTTFSLPMHLGQFSLRTPSLALLENADGTVSLLYPADLTYRINGSFRGVPRFSARLTASYGSYSVTASGSPGDITYATEVRDLTLGLAEITAPGADNMDFTVTGAFPAFSSSTRVTERALIRIQGEAIVAANEFRATAIIDGSSAETTATYGRSVSTFDLSLPATGSDILNLAPALKAGMTLLLTSVTEGNSTSTTTRLADDSLNSQSNASTAANFTLRLDRTALQIEASAEGLEIHLEDGTNLPFPIDLTAATVTANIAIPVSAGPDPQNFRYAFTLADMRLGYAVWARFDPDKQLPRDPATMTVDLAGTITSAVDLFDVMALASLEDQPTSPVTLNSLSIDALGLSAAGASVSGTGAFSLDNTDLTTFDGLPRPEGSFDARATGLNGLIDRLVASGFVTADAAMGARLGLGMVTDVVGDDELRSTVDINAAGHVTVNGQRIR